jgi:peptidoglycan/LPS O-acetylase OafA/YrhL
MPKSVNSAPLYFRHFNTIRFVAALMVFYSHMQQGYYEYICKSNDSINHDITGRNGVLLFFVLSGFLITSILLNEKNKTQKINLKNFYFKRVLRIWPLYFLIIIFAFWIAPAVDFFYIADFQLENRFYTKLLIYSFFLNNLASFLGTIPYAWHLWSIATEEQFYLIWPLIFKKFHPFKALIMLLFIYLFTRFALNHASSGVPILNILREWANMFIISSMIIGGLFAYILHIGRKLNHIKLELGILFLSMIALSYLSLNQIDFGFFNAEVYSVLFGVMIYIIASSDYLQINLPEFKLFSFMGKISYGLYMYQAITIIVIYKLAVLYNLNSMLFIYLSSILLLVSISSLSFRYFENPILNLKKKLK